MPVGFGGYAEAVVTGGEGGLVNTLVVLSPFLVFRAAAPLVLTNDET